MRVRDVPRSTFVIVTDAPGIKAPVASVMLPRIRPVLPCENAGTAIRKTATPTEKIKTTFFTNESIVTSSEKLLIPRAKIYLKRRYLIQECPEEGIPLLAEGNGAEEGWSAAPGWSVRRDFSAGLLLRLRPIGLALRATPSLQSELQPESELDLAFPVGKNFRV